MKLSVLVILASFVTRYALKVGCSIPEKKPMISSIDLLYWRHDVKKPLRDMRALSLLNKRIFNGDIPNLYPHKISCESEYSRYERVSE